MGNAYTQTARAHGQECDVGHGVRDARKGRARPAAAARERPSARRMLCGPDPPSRTRTHEAGSQSRNSIDNETARPARRNRGGSITPVTHAAPPTHPPTTTTRANTSPRALAQQGTTRQALARRPPPSRTRIPGEDAAMKPHPHVGDAPSGLPAWGAHAPAAGPRARVRRRTGSPKRGGTRGPASARLAPRNRAAAHHARPARPPAHLQ